MRFEVELQPRFFERCAAFQKDKAHKFEGPYENVLGLYSDVPFLRSGGRMRSVEEYIAQRLDLLLARRRHESSHKPVVALDVGGGVGVSWLRLAGAFHEAIAAGRLVMAVTSLQNSPAPYLRLAMALSRSKMLPAAAVTHAIRQCEGHGDKVYYLGADFSTFEGLILPIGDEPLSLLGNTDFVHERNALTGWSRIPELHIPRIAELVSPEGEYLVSREDIGSTFGRMKVKGEAEARLAGIQAAHNALPELFHLTMVDTVELGPHVGEPLEYRVFRGADSWPVTMLDPGMLDRA